jgi:acetyl-CoA carboxylase carboxyl transferase subunit beta
MSWLTGILPRIKRKDAQGAAKKSVPEGVWNKCQQCGRAIYGEEFARSLRVCAACDFHHRIGADERAQILFDDAPTEIAANIRARDVLKFADGGSSYSERLERAQDGDARREAVRVYIGRIEKRECVAAIFDFRFLGGSMGSVAGERFVRAAEAAAERRLPLLCFAASGGARMQEGLLSLLQMAKTTSALRLLASRHLPFISILTDPTTGGVAASFALIGDIVIAEPKALIGFAGPRVIQETVREVLPENFQRSEFLLRHGAIDAIIDRREMRPKLAKFIGMLTAGEQRS